MRRTSHRHQTAPGAPANEHPTEGAPPAGATAPRGREADRPSQIPRPGWRDILLRVWQQIGEDNVSIMAAGVAFYSLLAIFPAITAFVSLYGIVADPSQAQAQMHLLEGIVPSDALRLLGGQLQAVAAARAGRLGLGALVATGLAL
jgi:membrane protein